jgi:hypothetical protein
LQAEVERINEDVHPEVEHHKKVGRERVR